MPNLRIPIRNGPHRIAGIALYRALLTQCRALPHESHQRDELQNVVRNRFKQARHSQSAQRLRVSFQAGYEAIDHLDAAVAGDEESKQYITDLLARAPARIKLPPPIDERLRAKLEKKAPPSETDKPAQQPKKSILDRPLPLERLSGPRHVPVLFNANRIPVLRIKKPQPESLSRYIRQRVEQRQSWHDRRWRLYAEQEIARREDEWEKIVEPNLRAIESMGMAEAMKDHPATEPSWAAAVEVGVTEVEKKLDEEREKSRIMAEKMQDVVDREQELFDKERADRQRVKRREYRHRRRQRLKEDPEVNDDHDKTEPTESVAAHG